MITALILDNSTTGTTGLQDHAGTGITLMKEETKALNIERLCRTVGVERVKQVDAFDLEFLEATLKEELRADKLSVIISNRPCALLPQAERHPAVLVDETCTGCRQCNALHCPSLIFNRTQAIVEGKEKKVWEKKVKEGVPKHTAALNVDAFRKGRRLLNEYRVYSRTKDVTGHGGKTCPGEDCTHSP